MVAIPPEAVQQAGPNPFVWLKDDQSKAATACHTGITGLTTSRDYVWLKCGRSIVLAPPNTSLAAGMSLKLAAHLSRCHPNQA